jgi:Holliday junction resolvase RusA-like endonuclease
MKGVRFTVPGAPVGKGRHRSQPLMRGGKPVMGAGGRPIITSHTPEKTVAYEGLVAHEGRIAMRGRPLLAGPVELVLHIACAVPASWSKRKQADALAGRIRPTKKPDSSNVLKAIEDGLNGVVWVDDVQVVEHLISKRYAEAPGVAVEIEELENEAA